MCASSALTGELNARNRFEEDVTNTMSYDVLAGLRAQQKYIPSKYLLTMPVDQGFSNLFVIFRSIIRRELSYRYSALMPKTLSEGSGTVTL